METVLGSRSRLDNVSLPNFVLLLLTTCIAGGIIYLIRHAISRRSPSSLEQDSSKNLDQLAAAPVNDNANHYTSAQRRNRSKNRRNRSIPVHSWEIATLKGHTDCIYDLSFSHNAKFVVTCSADYLKKLELLRRHQISNTATLNMPEMIIQERNIRIQSNRCETQEKNETGQRLIDSATKCDKMTTKCDQKRGQREQWHWRFTSMYKKNWNIKQPTSDLHRTGDERRNMFQINFNFYATLHHFIMSSHQMVFRGFPVELRHFPNCAIINNIIYPSQNIIKEKDNKNENLTDTFVHEQNLSGINKRTCARCRMVYYVDESGKYLREECCFYHHGKLWSRGYDDENIWSCCTQLQSSLGCTKADVGHVWNGFVQPGRNGPFTGYVHTESSVTPSNPQPEYSVYALDCEMCYTQSGLELTKVTLVNLCGKIVYNKFVKPRNKIIDYNTRFSGITEEDLLHVTTTLEDVQEELKTIIFAETILLGHNLAGDFRMLRLFHNKVIDTSQLFPHPYQPFPYCSSLKTLANLYLDWEIQRDTHDSFEDACAVKNLVLFYAQTTYQQSQEIGNENILYNYSQ